MKYGVGYYTTPEVLKAHFQINDLRNLLTTYCAHFPVSQKWHTELIGMPR
ncbi:MAG: hypothetical protein QNI90_07195 [Dinoroseobacter sp.]|nr:hypothetical protein [Dinoroseobacter sp.]